MKNAILINAYPIDSKRRSTLLEQILNFKNLNLPIILCSGCDLDQEIINSVSYYFINKEKIVKPKKFFKESFRTGMNYVSCNTFFLQEKKIAIFEENVDLTISKNTKLLFEFAKRHNFENVLYTEDDIVIKNLNYYKENLNILNLASSEVKMCAVKCFLKKFLFSCHFFSNVDFFLENFKLPSSVEDLYNTEIYNKIKPYQIYEKSFTNSFEDQKDFIHIINSEYFKKSIDFSFCYFRQNDINFTIKNHCIFFKNYFENKTYFIFNNVYKENLLLKITKNKNFIHEIDLQCGHHILIDNIELNDVIEVEITDMSKNIFKKTMQYCSEDDIHGCIFI